MRFSIQYITEKEVHIKSVYNPYVGSADEELENFFSHQEFVDRPSPALGVAYPSIDKRNF